MSTAGGAGGGRAPVTEAAASGTQVAPVARRRKLGEILIDAGVLTQEDLDKALAVQKERGGRLGSVLVSLGLIDEDIMLTALETQLGIPRVELARYIINPEVARLLPEAFVRSHKVFPIERVGDRITLAMADPLDVFAIDDVRISTGLEVDPVIASEAEIEAAIAECYGSGPAVKLVKEVQAQVAGAAGKAQQARADEARKAADDAQVMSAPAVRLANAIISEAVKARASDIHIEPQESQVRVRYRVDGVLRQVMTFPKELGPAVASRIKVTAGMDIAERRVPQDGRVEIRAEGEEVDLRVSTLPTLYGEKVEIRILRSKGAITRIDELGFLEADAARLRQVLARPNGIVLVTGPTGSGKTMTLYAALHELNSPEKNIVTIEDPVEFRVSGLNQVQTNPRAGLTFSAGLRAILRQDPDIVMVGEIRDRETAEIAIRFAMTGHLVLSTFHTIDAAGALVRLMEMGVEPYLVSSSVTAVVAQRLVRKVCPYCAEEYEADPATWAAWSALAPDTAARVEAERGRVLRRGPGCRQCANTGCYGRTAIAEVMVVDDRIRALVMKSAPADDIEDAAVRAGMTRLVVDGARKVLLGITTPQELAKVCAVPDGKEDARSCQYRNC
ncbi:MAG: Flp pilus assembly complex ATPase component TadA [Firmicutes bacterium]|nr:Flp pilus assembly complex ATPase component TadA [Bacillota bacterium]